LRSAKSGASWRAAHQTPWRRDAPPPVPVLAHWPSASAAASVARCSTCCPQMKMCALSTGLQPCKNRYGRVAAPRRSDASRCALPRFEQRRSMFVHADSQVWPSGSAPLAWSRWPLFRAARARTAAAVAAAIPSLAVAALRSGGRAMQTIPRTMRSRRSAYDAPARGRTCHRRKAGDFRLIYRSTALAHVHTCSCCAERPPRPACATEAAPRRRPTTPPLWWADRGRSRSRRCCRRARRPRRAATSPCPSPGPPAGAAPVTAAPRGCRTTGGAPWARRA